MQVRHLLLIGRLDEAERGLAELDPGLLSAASRTTYELALAGISIRRLQIRTARAALVRAERAALDAGIPALTAEVESAIRLLHTPAARLLERGKVRSLLLADVEALMASTTFIVDACRHTVRDASAVVSLVGRPVLFALARALAEAWPGDITRDRLVAAAFGAKEADESHRARLRVEIGRLRREMRGMAEVNATKRGFAMTPRRSPAVVVLERPVEELAPGQSAVLALLADGESWSSSALALALATSQRKVQRSLESLASDGSVRPIGRGRGRRWMTSSVPEFTTILLLPASLPTD